MALGIIINIYKSGFLFFGVVEGVTGPRAALHFRPLPPSPRLECPGALWLSARLPDFNFYIVLIVYITYTILLNYSLNNRLSNSFIFSRQEKHGFKPFLRHYIFMNSRTILSAICGHSYASCLSIHPAVAAALAREPRRSYAARLCPRRFAPAPGR